MNHTILWFMLALPIAALWWGATDGEAHKHGCFVLGYMALLATAEHWLLHHGMLSWDGAGLFGMLGLVVMIPIWAAAASWWEKF